MKKSDLLQALEIVKPGLANKEVVDQATSFAFIKGRVVTYNDEISVSCPVEGLDIEGAISAQELYNYLKKVKKDEIETEITESEIIFKTGRAKAGLVLYSEIKLPLDSIAGKKKWKELPGEFLKAMIMAVEVTARDTSKPIVNSIHINEGGYMEATDNYRFLQYHVEGMELPTMLIPSSSVREILKFKPEFVDVGKGWVFFKTKSGAELSCRIIDDPFPNASHLLEKEGEPVIFPNTVLEIIDRAQVFAESGESDHQIRITLKDRRIIFESQSSAGWFKETANIRWEGDFSFTITPALLKGILKETREGFLCDERLLKFVGESWIYVAMLVKSKE